MPAEREGRRTNDPPPERGGNGGSTLSSPVTGQGTTRRHVLLTAAGGFASVAGVGRTRGTSTVGGDEIWRFKMKYPLSTSPTVVDGTVYVGSTSDQWENGIAYALYGDSGEERWRFDRRWVEYRYWGSQSEYSPVHPILGALQVVDGTVYVPGHGVNALDQETGEQLWHSEDDGYLGGLVRSSPTVSQGTVYLGNGSRVAAFNAAVGKLRWADGPTPSGRASPAVVDGMVYAASGDTLFAYDGETGDEAWRLVFEQLSGLGSSPTVVDGTLYANIAGFVLGLDPDSGQERMRYDPDWGIRSSLTAADGTVYMGGESYESDRGLVAAFDTADGEERWQFEPRDAVHSSPTVADNTLFVGSDDGFLYALDVADGSERWRFEAGAEIRSAPIVVDGTVYVADTAGTVYALDAGVRDSSEDSRVLLGTDNHHHVWAREASADVAPAEFVVELDAEPSTVTTGDEIRVQITITNVGDETGKREVYYHGPGSFGGPIELEGGESQTIELSDTVDNPYSPTPLHEWRDEVPVTVGVFEDEDRLTIPVEEPLSERALDRLPGFGPLGALGGLGGAGYLLNRRQTDD